MRYTNPRTHARTHSLGRKRNRIRTLIDRRSKLLAAGFLSAALSLICDHCWRRRREATRSIEQRMKRRRMSINGKTRTARHDGSYSFDLNWNATVPSESSASREAALCTIVERILHYSLHSFCAAHIRPIDCCDLIPSRFCAHATQNR